MTSSLPIQILYSFKPSPHITSLSVVSSHDQYESLGFGIVTTCDSGSIQYTSISIEENSDYMSDSDHSNNLTLSTSLNFDIDFCKYPLHSMNAISTDNFCICAYGGLDENIRISLRGIILFISSLNI